MREKRGDRTIRITKYGHWYAARQRLIAHLDGKCVVVSSAKATDLLPDVQAQQIAYSAERPYRGSLIWDGDK